MRFPRWWISVAALLAVGTPFPGSSPFAEVMLSEPVIEKELRNHAHALNACDPSHYPVSDTVWIGHVCTNTGLPGQPGGYGPFHIGRGANRPFVPGPTMGHNGIWSFDCFQAGEADSLQGWRPVAGPYQYTGGAVVSDLERPSFAFDYGNQGNYVSKELGVQTFGVIGYWHRDFGSFAGPSPLPGTNPVPVTWPPISGLASA